MLRPDEIDELPDRIEALYQLLDLFIVTELVNILSKACSTKDVMEWLAMKEGLLEATERAIRDEIEDALNMTRQELRMTLEDASILSATKEVERMAEGGLDAEHIATGDFLDQYVNAAYNQTNGEFENLGQTTGFVGGDKNNPLYDAFIDSLDNANMQVMSGTLTYEEAIEQAIEDLVNKGVQVVNYESGYAMNVSSAARMITMTGVAQMENQMSEAICDDLGLDLVEVTAHGGARPTHKPWQGKVFSRHGNKGKYKDLAEATGYGTVQGLGGANCRHTFYGYLEGTPRTYTDEQLKNIDPPPFTYNGKEYDLYHANQRMRYMERQIRKTKRQMAAYDAAGMEDEFNAAAIKLQRMNREYKDFAKAGNIRPRQDRVQEIMYTRELSDKARRVKA